MVQVHSATRRHRGGILESDRFSLGFYDGGMGGWDG